MLSALARALETIFGAALAPTAALLRPAATLALVAALLLAGRAIVRAIAAWRYGWIPATLVRCPRCGQLAGDPARARCPEGHEVRFPARAIRRLAVPESSARRLARHAYPIVLAAALAAAILAAYLLADIHDLIRPISTITASLAFLFFCSAVCAAGFALRPRPSGAVTRILHAGLAAACFFPALVLALLSRGFEPPVEKEIGSLWTTPTALYVTGGGRARREGPPAVRLDAIMDEVTVPGLGVVWEGLEGFDVLGRRVPWKGAGGATARLLGWWVRPSDRSPGLFRRSLQFVTLEPNHRVRILASRDHVRFVSGP